MTAESQAQSTSGEIKDVAKSEVANVASTTKDGAREVAGAAAIQARSVVDEAKHQVTSLFGQAQGEVGHQLSNQTGTAADGLQSLSQQLRALSAGRPDEAGPLVGYLDDAGQQVSRLASRLQEGGFQGAMDDVTSFARRRPGLFLLGAVGAGFAVGRLVRSGVSVAKDDQPTVAAPTPALDAGHVGGGVGSVPMATPAPVPLQPGVSEVPV